MRLHYFWFAACLVTFITGAEYGRRSSPTTTRTVEQLRFELGKQAPSRAPQLTRPATLEPELRRPVVVQAPSHARPVGAAPSSDGRGASNDAAAAAGGQEYELIPSLEEDSAYDRLSQRINDAIQRRRWTETDAAMLRHQLSLVDDVRRGELMGEISVSINEGRLVFEGTGMPY